MTGASRLPRSLRRRALTRERDEFYVGYLPMPPGQRRFVRKIAPAILWTMVLVCGITLWFMKRPAPASWETGALLELQGVVRAEPYPLLELHGPDGRVESILLTGIGKRGAQIAPGFNGAWCSVRGYPLEREGRRILELMDGHEGILRPGTPAPSWPALERESLGKFTFRGEILDSKCWHGAMRPGEGRAHKACATLCVRGGIAPMLTVREGPMLGEVFLLTDAAGHSATAQVLDLLGEPILATGLVLREGSLLWMRLDPDGIVPVGEMQ